MAIQFIALTGCDEETTKLVIAAGLGELDYSFNGLAAQRRYIAPASQSFLQRQHRVNDRSFAGHLASAQAEGSRDRIEHLEEDVIKAYDDAQNAALNLLVTLPGLEAAIKRLESAISRVRIAIDNGDLEENELAKALAMTNGGGRAGGRQRSAVAVADNRRSRIGGRTGFAQQAAQAAGRQRSAPLPSIQA